MPTKTDPGNTNKHKAQLDAVLIQLGSQRPSDIWRGLEQIRQWLRENPEDQDVYGLLLDAVQMNRDLRESARNILIDMMQNSSRIAEEAIRQLPSGISDILADADDAYYAAEYEKALQLYRQVLRLEPDNTEAKEHMAKAILKRKTGELPTDLPRAAQQYYRRARSYVAARELVTALNLLSAAMEAADAKGMKYPEAEDELNNVQNLILAEEFVNKAKDASKKRQRREAIEFYKKALKLDSTNTDIRKRINAQLMMLNARWGIPILIVIAAGFFAFKYSAGTIALVPATPPATVEIRSSSTPTFEATSVIIKTTEPVTNTETPSLTSTMTFTPSPTLTETASPTSTEETIGIGYINKAVASVWQEPNAGFLGQLGLNQPLTLLEERPVSGSTWYRCRWESNGEIHDGWILMDNINFGPPPP